MSEDLVTRLGHFAELSLSAMVIVTKVPKRTAGEDNPDMLGMYCYYVSEKIANTVVRRSYMSRDFPTLFTIPWRRQSKAAAIIAALLGMETGLSVWPGSAHALYGSVSIATTGEILPCMYGRVASAFSPLPYFLLITLIKPRDFNGE